MIIIGQHYPFKEIAFLTKNPYFLIVCLFVCWSFTSDRSVDLGICRWVLETRLSIIYDDRGLKQTSTLSWTQGRQRKAPGTLILILGS